jgi:hypothetical protein
MGLRQQKTEVAKKTEHRIHDYHSTPQQIQAPPIMVHSTPPSVTEHTTRNFDKVSARERVNE